MYSCRFLHCINLSQKSSRTDNYVWAIVCTYVWTPFNTLLDVILYLQHCRIHLLLTMVFRYLPTVYILTSNLDQSVGEAHCVKFLNRLKKGEHCEWLMVSRKVHLMFGDIIKLSCSCILNRHTTGRVMLSDNERYNTIDQLAHYSSTSGSTQGFCP